MQRCGWRCDSCFTSPNQQRATFPRQLPPNHNPTSSTFSSLSPQRRPLPSKPNPNPPPTPLRPHLLLPGRRLRRAGDALTGSRWFPVEGPTYVSFVSKAVLWDRGLCRFAARDRPDHHPFFCPRFLSHMRARPEDLRPPHFLSSGSRPQPPSQGKTPSTHSPTGLKTQTLEGSFHLNRGRRRIMQNQGSISQRSSAVIVPHLPLVASPPSSTINPSPPNQNTRQLDSVEQEKEANTVIEASSEPQEEEYEVKEKGSAVVVSVPEKDLKYDPRTDAPEHPLTPVSPVSLVSLVSPRSLSDVSRPPSSLFSRSTDLCSSSSLPSADFRGSDSEYAVCVSEGQSPPVLPSPLASFTSAPSNPRPSSRKTTTPLPLHRPLSPDPAAENLPPPLTPLSRPRSATTPENLHQEDPAVNVSLVSDPAFMPLAFSSATWSSCPSPQGTTPRFSRSGLKLIPASPLGTRLESRRWSVLPPISPARGRSVSEASHVSELSFSQSHVFDELEAVAPRSTSSLSLDETLDSSGRPSPDTDLSPGLAALTVGCHSGDLGSLSRVQLLLLDRMEPDTAEEPDTLDEDWSDLMTRYDPGLTDPAGVLRPFTAASVSERCDSAGKVRENKSDRCSTGSPTSWIIDPSPSYDMFSSSSSAEERGPTLEESFNYPGLGDRAGPSSGGRGPGSPEDRKMEERKTKVLNMLSKLQDETPRQTHGRKGQSNFEEFDFLAKYCIFSQEELAEYKRAFEAEDSDGDGYISCLQVLLALKTLIPAELLSEEEEIYVYRILEMVDFRVTDGLVDLRLFAVVASLAQKIASMDEFMRSLIMDMDFRSLEVRLFKAKQLFLFLLEEQQGDQPGFISAEQLLLELKAGGIHPEKEAAIRQELKDIPPLGLLDFLAYLPLFMLIHKLVISNPLDDSSNL